MVERAQQATKRVETVKHRYKILPQVTVPVGGAYTEKKSDRVARATQAAKGAELGPSFERAQAKCAHLKGALLAERHARGPGLLKKLPYIHTGKGLPYTRAMRTTPGTDVDNPIGMDWGTCFCSERRRP